jgi:hypothetical protein
MDKILFFIILQKSVVNMIHFIFTIIYHEILLKMSLNIINLNLNIYHEPFVNAIGINHACELTSNLQWWSSIAHISLGCSFL